MKFNTASSSALLLAVPALAQDCAAPGNAQPEAIATLPDPFLPLDGARVTTKAEFECRQQEISSLFQQFELGTFPPAPTSVKGTLSGDTLTIDVEDGGSSVSFTVSVSLPSGGSGPYPAIIAYGMLSIPQPDGVGVITFTNDDVAAQQDTSSRGQGIFYDLYGSDHTASATTAWAWGVSRIIDAIESLEDSNIDATKIAVTGCSRNGKGAIIAGALEPRVALTIPQESGSGGAACWRLSDEQKANGENVQTADQIITENVWFSTAFEQYVSDVSALPVDHHMLAGLVAPRGLYVIENTDMEWLGAMSTFGCMTVGHKIYEALGAPDAMGYSQVGGHNHCQFPSSQQTELDAFVNKFLLGKEADTAIFKTDGSYDFDEAQWADWTVPELA
ncbi:hypothetical protein FQN54_005506 [Arachnomyces sp. PD_36]|nr:hypothetical protein FQN54_005506 [Arachnomyces sp. PD_36]